MTFGMRTEELEIRAGDGFSLAATLHHPEAPEEESVVLVNAGTGIRRGFYARFAAFLASCGFPVLTWDYRGIGDSRPASLRGLRAAMRDWGREDLEALLGWVGERHPGRPILVVGHSAGGQILGLAPSASRISAVLAVAAQSGWYRHWPVPRRYLMAGLWWGLMPAATALCGYFPSRALGLGEDLPKGVALEWARWCRNPQYMVDASGAPLRPHFADLRAPVLAFSFADDPFAPRAAVEQLLSFYTEANVTHRHVVPSEIGLRGVGHFGFFRETCREVLWKECVDWLRRRGAAAERGVA